MTWRYDRIRLKVDGSAFFSGYGFTMTRWQFLPGNVATQNGARPGHRGTDVGYQKNSGATLIVEGQLRSINPATGERFNNANVSREQYAKNHRQLMRLSNVRPDGHQLTIYTPLGTLEALGFVQEAFKTERVSGESKSVTVVYYIPDGILRAAGKSRSARLQRNGDQPINLPQFKGMTAYVDDAELTFYGPFRWISVTSTNRFNGDVTTIRIRQTVRRGQAIRFYTDRDDNWLLEGLGGVKPNARKLEVDRQRLSTGLEAFLLLPGDGSDDTPQVKVKSNSNAARVQITAQRAFESVDVW